MLMYSAMACLEHSNFFKVNVPNSPTTTVKSSRGFREEGGRPVLASRRTSRGARNHNYELLTATTLIYAIGAGITGAAGTRLALQLFLVKGFRLYSFQLPDYDSPALLFIVTTPRVGIG